jgi:cytochrome c oxidase subunit 2
VQVDLYERIWMWMAAVVIALFLGAIVFAAGSAAIQPPSHMETIDPTTVLDDPEFGNPGVEIRDDGRVVVSMVAEQFFFSPDPVEVPAGRPVTFRITSADVIHGFEVVGTNANVMVIPGYVSQLTVTFDEPGEHLILCHEYCGLLHHEMVGRLIVQEDDASPEASS